ncbi:TetR/AcrR family transcriptional regulator [Actinoplanes couchii]|uniref:TetR family transcriptional regulator n=1 Tax=Actinoplanes couchii TaxID=403638 RepID=A0ABQ3XEI5_9ACTN|nr:TetR family transcriptional regulator C-terminal domain-containing protein [Actinoplanes couchii]MDR6319784.1 AcrR family transcriptional regulator [Actinoplanes couchii]GID56919.1 TetR family transcriptional regulator [Actinoplanes couchii]
MAQQEAGRGDAARERVLHAALRAIAAHGYRGSTLAGIAAGAALTNAGLLHHFPSKEHLLVAVLAERDRLDTAHFRLDGCRGLAALDRLVELVRYNTMVPGLVQTFTVLAGESAGSDHPAREWFRERYLRLRADIATALRNGITAGEIRADVDCDAQAAGILAMMDGLQVQWLLAPERFDMAAVFADYVAMVRRAIG